MACRVTFAPCESVVADRAPPEPSLVTTDSRVPSPSAKKTSAAACSRPIHVLSKVLRLSGPAAVVHAERPRTPVCRYALEPRLDDREGGALGDRLEPELDEGRGLVLRIRFCIDPERDPAEAEVALRLHAVDGEERHVPFGNPQLRG